MMLDIQWMLAFFLQSGLVRPLSPVSGRKLAFFHCHQLGFLFPSPSPLSYGRPISFTWTPLNTGLFRQFQVSVLASCHLPYRVIG